MRAAAGRRRCAGDDVAGAIERRSPSGSRADYAPSLQPRHQRHRRDHPHQPGPGAARAQAAVARVAAIAAATRTSSTTSTRGARGRRDVHAERLLRRLTGAEAAVVVNNNAAATLLVARRARGRPRGASSRAANWSRSAAGSAFPTCWRSRARVLREVGTTNRTRIADYAAAIARSDGADPAGPSVQLPDRRVHRAAVARGTRRARAPLRAAGRRRSSEADTSRFGQDSRRCATSPMCARSIAAGADLVHVQRRQTVGRTAGRDHRRPGEQRVAARDAIR